MPEARMLNIIKFLITILSSCYKLITLSTTIARILITANIPVFKPWFKKSNAANTVSS